MTKTYYTVNFAQAYGENSYSECTYNDTTSCTTSGGGSTGGGNTAGSSGGSSALTNTGLMIAIIVTLACLIALAAIIVRVVRRPGKKLAQEAVSTDDSQLRQQQ